MVYWTDPFAAFDDLFTSITQAQRMGVNALIRSNPYVDVLPAVGDLVGKTASSILTPVLSPLIVPAVIAFLVYQEMA